MGPGMAGRVSDRCRFDHAGTLRLRSSLFRQLQRQEAFMHKDEAKGAGKQTKGALKDAAGGLTGDEKLQAEGKMDKLEGKLQQKGGEAKEKVRDALKH